MFTVYILQSYKSGRYYVGYTTDVKKRLQRHNSGRNISTRYYKPWKLVRQEHFADRKDAWLRERQIKSYKGGVAFKKLVGEG